MMLRPLLLLVPLVELCAAAPSQAQFTRATTAAEAAWPNGPFTTSDRWIHDASGNTITYAGANWPGAADVMIPEGLQHQSVATIVSKIKSLGMNAIRLTYAIQMIDEIYENNGQDVTVQQAFTQALGAANGSAMYQKVLANNPSFGPSTTRLDVFNAIAAECASQQIYVHLDNHISKGEWCCSSTDGNSWPGDTYFGTSKWLRGLAYMASHAASWPALTSMSLRNELRDPINNPTLSAQSYNWATWYDFTKQAAAAIHDANPDVLIFLSGLNFDTYLTPVVRGTALTPGTGKFSFNDFSGFANKLVLELHNYENGATNCTALKQNLRTNGFQAHEGAAGGAANVFPVVLTEFGFQMDSSTWQGVYASCIADYLAEQKAGWFIWVVAGSYYIRSGTMDFDETWGLMTHDWSAWRSQRYVDGALLKLVRETI